MRGLNPEFEKEFLENGKFRGIIEYVKKQDDVFLGVRENYINLYVDGGSFFKLEYKSRKGHVGSFDEKYYKYCIERKPKKLSSINGKKLQDIKYKRKNNRRYKRLDKFISRFKENSKRLSRKNHS